MARTNRQTNRQTNTRTWRLYDRPGPEGRVGEKQNISKLIGFPEKFWSSQRFSPTPSSGPGWSLSRHVRLFVRAFAENPLSEVVETSG